ncbi:hypothetical protein VNI00_019219, partial [Paramarasmius palmivorus]
MGGFALYDEDQFCGYVWNDGSASWQDPSGVGMPVRNEMQEYYLASRTAAVVLDRK